MDSFTITISTNYVKAWGIWEAVREILQNAYDQNEADPASQVHVTYSPERNGKLLISTSTGHLEASSLVLGESRKHEGSRGKFGEGYKLALLVLLRENKGITIQNGDEYWTPKLEFNKRFGTELLTIKTSPRNHSPGVAYLLEGITPEEWAQINFNVHAVRNQDKILFEEHQKGRIYVGGLYVTTIKDLKFGYCFKASTVKLDRDRGMVNNFDIEYQTSKLWTESSSPQLYQLIKDEVRDVAYCESHAPTSIYNSFYTFYREEHGDAIPVTTQEEIKAVQESGKKWALVPTLLKTMLNKVKTWVIPTSDSPAKRLRKLIDKHYFDVNVKAELEDIITILENK